MIGLQTINVNLQVNSNSALNTNQVFIQGDNKTAEFKFRIYAGEHEINYSDVQLCTLTAIFQDNTTLGRCECVVNSDSISKLLCSDMLPEEGTVTCRLKLYGADEEIFTTSIFRFIIVKRMDESDISEAMPSIIDQALSKLAKLDEQWSTAESKRVTAELARAEAEIERQKNEQDRITAEELRETAEANRASEFNTMKTEFEGMTICPSMIVPIEAQTAGTLSKLLFVVPTGYNYKILDIKILSSGSPLGIDDQNTVDLNITEGSDTIATETFNTANTFPSANGYKTLTIVDGLIDKDDEVYLSMVLNGTAETPDFSLQVQYEIV